MQNRFSSLAFVVLCLEVTACGEPSTGFDGAAGRSPSSAAGSSGSGGTSAGAGGSGASAGDGASAGASDGAGPGPGSVGCGATSWPEGDQRAYTIDVDGTSRKYILTIPENYDPSHPHRLVFTWHGRGGTAEQIASGFGGSGYYGLAGRIGEGTIFVSGQGLGTDEDPDDTGWPNSGGRDIAFVRALLDWLNESYCIDQNRIFSTGMSYGGIMSITIGCQMSDVFRGIAPIAGALFGGPGTACSPGPIAVWQTHGSADTVVTIDGGERARDAFLAANGCGTTSQPVAPEPCVSYEGCAEGYPVVWCVHDGGHTIPSFSSDSIAVFFEAF